MDSTGTSSTTNCVTIDPASLDPSAAVESLRQQLESFNLDSRGNKKTLKSRLQHIKRHGLPSPSSDTVPANVAQKQQTLRWLLVIDFEATCDAPSASNLTTNSTSKPDSSIAQGAESPEIIEFPIVLVDLEKGKIVATFQSYVQPVERPKLSEFCTQLTGITQPQVDEAPVFEKVLEQVNQWLSRHCAEFIPPILGNEGSEADSGAKESGSRHFNRPRHRIRNWSLVTDGRTDLERFLTRQLESSGLEYPDWSIGPYVESRALFAMFSSSGRGTLRQQLSWCGLDFEGREHSGLDDAVNIARVVLSMHSRGAKIEVNRFMEKVERGWLRRRNRREAQQGKVK